jgi:hypothetical protein
MGAREEERMPNRLQDLTVDYVSLVDRAAVRDPQHKSEPRRFLVWKREGAELPTTAKGGDHMEKSAEELRAELEKSEREKKEAEEARDAAKAAVEKVEKERDEALAKAAAKSPGEGGDKDDTTDPKKPPVKKEDLSPEARAALEKAESDNAALAERLTKAEKQAEAADELAKAERNQRVTREFISKAEELRALPAQAVTLGPILKSADEGVPLTKEQNEELNRILKAADEQIRRSDLFKEVGASTAPGSGTDALSKLQSKAEELRKSDSSLSAAEALDKAMQDNPDLEREYAGEIRR